MIQNLAFDALGASSPMTHALERFVPRLAQQQMAALVFDVLGLPACAVIEAGTGTGKTLAYLIPALLSEKKIIISTGTKTLQDQLFNKDLPLLQRAYAKPLKVALLKGRGNYLCHYRCAQAQLNSQQILDPWRHRLQVLSVWAQQTRTGELSEVPGMDQEHHLRPWVTSTAENCLGGNCPDFERCFVFKARRTAQQADWVIVNHHLFFADLILKDNGANEFLPSVDAFILDEAHQLPEIAARAFSESLNDRQCKELADDTTAEILQATGNAADLPPELAAFRKAQAVLQALWSRRPQARQLWSLEAADKSVRRAVEKIYQALDNLRNWFKAQKELSRGLSLCAQRCSRLLSKLDLVQNPDPRARACWLSADAKHFQWQFLPLDLAEMYQERVQALNAAWVYTSATLTVGGKFDHFCKQLGIQTEHTLSLPSPFDFARRALIYVPEAAVEGQNDAQYTESVIREALPVIETCPGGAFLLFTSHRALKQAAELLQGRTDRVLLVQGQESRELLLHRFREDGRALLLGTASFWEGVDVRGPALSCVIIDRLPFASPEEEYTQARIAAAKAQGLNAFGEHQLPHAVLALKQGFGRLIRDETDRGVIMIADRRLVSKPYGKVFLRSLPSMRLTRDFAEVQEFFAVMEDSATAGIGAADAD